MVAVAIAGAGVLSATGAIAGSSIAASGAQKAAQTEANAQQQAIAAQQSMYQQGTAAQQQYFNTALQQAQQYYGTAQGIEQPFVNIGQTAGTELQNELMGGTLGAMPSLTDMSQLPGYAFTLQQGLNATQNAAAAQGLGVSGVALKGASQYAENTANTYYNNYLSNYWANQNNRYSMLAGVMGQGAQAAAQLGAQATGTGESLVSGASQQAAQALTGAVQTGGNIGTTITGTANAIAQAQQNAAQAQAAGITGAGNALSGGATNALLANALLGQQQGGSTVGGNPNALMPANQMNFLNLPQVNPNQVSPYAP